MPTITPQQTQENMRGLLLTSEGRSALLGERAEYASKVGRAQYDARFLGGSEDEVRRAIQRLSDFDGNLHAATGVVSGSGRVRLRSTGEGAEVLAWDRDITGTPMVQIATDEGQTVVYLVDVEAVA